MKELNHYNFSSYPSTLAEATWSGLRFCIALCQNAVNFKDELYQQPD